MLLLCSIDLIINMEIEFVANTLDCTAPSIFVLLSPFFISKPGNIQLLTFYLVPSFDWLFYLSQFLFIQEAYKRSNNWLPPPWAIVAMVVLGFNEFMLLLK